MVTVLLWIIDSSDKDQPFGLDNGIPNIGPRCSALLLTKLNVIMNTRSSRPTDILWPCHTILGSPACFRKYLAVLKLLTKYVFADPYANNTNLLYQI